MATATFVLGLCGAGKSWLADRIPADIKFHDGFWLAERRTANVAALIATLRGGGDAVVVEIEFCSALGRQQILDAISGVPDLNVRWICFENDLRKANQNCLRRQNHGNPHIQVQINEGLSPRYTYPDGADIVRCGRLPAKWSLPRLPNRVPSNLRVKPTPFSSCAIIRAPSRRRLRAGR